MTESTQGQYAAAVSVWADTYAANKARLEESRDELRDAVRQAVDVGGVSEKRAAELAGVTRMTVRAWLGKDKRV